MCFRASAEQLLRDSLSSRFVPRCFTASIHPLRFCLSSASIHRCIWGQSYSSVRAWVCDISFCQPVSGHLVITLVQVLLPLQSVSIRNILDTSDKARIWPTKRHSCPTVRLHRAHQKRYLLDPLRQIAIRASDLLEKPHLGTELFASCGHPAPSAICRSTPPLLLSASE